ncbi:CopD family protein [Chitinimonas arctica]|uniref:Protoporphyrinogen IX oxidase n=1 Tax=Chitinimonas arctica TaxID=2594795 RepID=A0A516SFM9_9NEIS|nr:CopD family protein [Chitinimonas arctica]QDQ26953.1 CopD family protein [Chitinimonas arctica]
MLWVKAFHIVFVISWMAGLLYLPRLFVNHAMATDEAARLQLALMERKLLRFTKGLSHMAIALGLWLWLGWGVYGHWLHAKLGLVVMLLAYQGVCGKLVRDFAAGNNQRSHTWFRFFNEVPALLMLGIVILVVVKPF